MLWYTKNKQWQCSRDRPFDWWPNYTDYVILGVYTLKRHPLYTLWEVYESILDECSTVLNIEFFSLTVVNPRLTDWLDWEKWKTLFIWPCSSSIYLPFCLPHITLMSLHLYPLLPASILNRGYMVQWVPPVSLSSPPLSLSTNIYSSKLSLRVSWADQRL